MKIFKEISLGFLTAIASSLVILGAIVVSMTEGLTVVVPTPEPTMTLPAVVETAIAGVPTLTPAPQTPTPRQVIVTNPPRATPCPAPEGWVSITVTQGDDLKAIAAERGVSVDEIKSRNCTQGIAPGSKIYVPPFPTPTLTPSLTFTLTFTRVISVTPSSTICPGPPASWVRYLIKSGDTLGSLSRLTGASIADIMAKNCLTNTNIRSGTYIFLPRLPGGTPTPTLRPTFTFTFGPTRTRTPIPSPLPTKTPTGTKIATLTSTLTDTPVTPTLTSTSTTFTIVTATPKPPSPTPTDTPTP